MNLNPQEQQELQAHLLAISKICYRHTPPEKLKTFESIEITVRDYMQTDLAPEIAQFFFQKSANSKRAEPEE